MSGDVGEKYEDAEHMATDRIWQLKSWSRDGMITVYSRWYRTVMHGIEPLGMAKRWSWADKNSIAIKQSFVNDQYSRNMGGIDRVDQNISTYHIIFNQVT